MINPHDWGYDLETYPNVFTASFKHVATGYRMRFEISNRKNDLIDLIQFLSVLKQTDCRMVGFNNIGFDYPIIHYIIQSNDYINVDQIYDKAQGIIDTPWMNRFDNIIWDSDVIIPQIDLFKIHHFDNDARRTSLKMLEFNMRSDSIQDLPYPPGTLLSNGEIPVLIDYNDKDVDETVDFYMETIEMIEFREQLSEKYNRNFLNHNDTKIGKDYFIMQLEHELPGSCYTRDVYGKRMARQTYRDSIALKDVIFPYIEFQRPEFQRIKDYLSSQVITETKGVFKDLNCVIDGFKYVFGVGGIHGSIDSSTVYSDDEYVLIDVDVASYYPNLAIKNRLYPEHLSEEFCEIYQDVYEQRQSYAKGTTENAMLKLALNGVYGDSNNKYSPFYDPQYTMSITINGQLLLCILAEHLINIPDLTVIQINTDGITVRLHREQVDVLNKICKWWESFTCLELESVEYSRMFIRDVNNYISEYSGGKLKRKGAYEYELLWHQNHSSLVIPKAAEAALVHGQCITDFIMNHDDIFDFMLRTKVGRTDKLMLGDEEVQRITRYYISNQGGSLTKISPPAKGHKVGSWKRATKLTDEFYNETIANLKAHTYTDHLPHDLDTNGLPWDARINTKNRSKYEIRKTGINVGWLISECNNIHNADRSNINYEYYIKEAEKIVEPLR